MKITLIKKTRGTETLRTFELEDVVTMMQEGAFRKEAEAFRQMLPILTLRREDDGSMRGSDDLKRVPRLCFAREMENRQHQRVNRGYTALVLLEVDNLKDYEEAKAVRRGAALMPHTLMAFVGVDHRSVKIVCRGELFNDSKGDKSNMTQLSEDDVKHFHTNLYERARLAYNAQLGVSIEKLEPRLDRTCYYSDDGEAYYNPSAISFYADAKSPVSEAAGLMRPSTLEPTSLAVRMRRYDNYHRIFEFNLTKALDDMNTLYDAALEDDRTDNAASGQDGTGSDDEAMRTHLLLNRVADYCVQTGIPMGMAQGLARSSHFFWDEGELVTQVFQNTYRQANEHRYRQRSAGPTTAGTATTTDPLRCIPPETLLTMKIDMFLQENYELRMNVMRGVAEYRERRGIGFDFNDLTEEARNSITMRALRQGIKCWDKDIRRYVTSNDIELYDPIADFLEQLPQWDGRDRVTPLAHRIKTDYEEWPHLFHIWMRSMVAMWQGRGQLTGNALVPLLIGRQGCGKSSFCRILLPRDQREYYNDRISFKNEADLNLGLTSFALINLDEFDKITGRQQVVLKYLVSTSDLKYRPPYGKAYQQHRRYASFIATTNDYMPLTDPSGSRRFICIEIQGEIDFETPIEYGQLYAQLKQELADGERYWLTKTEEQQLQRHNLRYQCMNGLGEMVLNVYRRPEGNEEGEWVTVSDIAAHLKQKFRSAFKENGGTLVKIGTFMNRPDYQFESRRRSQGMEYLVVER